MVRDADMKRFAECWGAGGLRDEDGVGGGALKAWTARVGARAKRHAACAAIQEVAAAMPFIHSWTRSDGPARALNAQVRGSGLFL